MGHLNVEIKARCANPTAVRDFLEKAGAEYRGIDHQIDTYYRVSDGRLKLREGTIENYLIHYKRENLAGPKASNVILYKTTPQSELKPILEAALPVLMVVDKQRHIFLLTT